MLFARSRARLVQELRDKGITDEAVLAAIVLDGSPGTPMPPWRFELSDDEAVWLVRQLAQGVTP